MNKERYEIKSGKLTGGFGAITELRDTYLDRDVLFKSMIDQANSEQLLNEVRHLTAARSRHIVEIYDVVRGDDGQLAGIIIEKLTGCDYLDFHVTASASPELALRAIYQIACALADLHSMGIVHRDLKLENFRESAAGVLKLFDFGISSPAQNYATATNRGTLVYAAPELYVQGAPTTDKVDIYALGVCCWKLLSSTIPSALLERPPQLTARADSIGSIAQWLPPQIISAIDACLEPNPNARPSAEAIRDLCQASLLKGRHKGKFVSHKRRQQVYELSSSSPNLRMAIAGFGDLRAVYTGTEFQVRAVTGEVFMNNQPLVPGTLLHDACVITFGNFAHANDREHISFVCSMPEIIL